MVKLVAASRGQSTPERPCRVRRIGCFQLQRKCLLLLALGPLWFTAFSAVVAVVPPMERRQMALSGWWAVRGAAAASLMGVLLAGRPAQAQQPTFHLDRLEVPGAPDDGLVLFRPATQERAIVYAQLGLGLSINPLRMSDVVTDDPATLRRSQSIAISNQFSTYMSAGFELLDRLTLGVTMPIAWEEAGNLPAPSPGFNPAGVHDVLHERRRGRQPAHRRALHVLPERGPPLAVRRAAEHLCAHGSRIVDQLRRRRQRRRADADGHRRVDAPALPDHRRQHGVPAPERQLDQRSGGQVRDAQRPGHRRRVALGGRRAAAAEQRQDPARRRPSSGRRASRATRPSATRSSRGRTRRSSATSRGGMPPADGRLGALVRGARRGLAHPARLRRTGFPRDGALRLVLGHRGHEPAVARGARRKIRESIRE